MKTHNNIAQKKSGLIFFAFIILAVLMNPIMASALPSGFETQVVASGLNSPTTISFSPDGRIFVAEKNGAVRVIKNGALLPDPLITISDVNTYGDRGLIGMAIDPNFSQNGYLYLAYTYENTPGLSFSGIKTSRVIRVTVVGDIAQESSKVVILGSVGGNASTPSCDNYPVTSDCIASDAPSHTIGGLRFGTDGKLYVATGDGAHFDYPDTRSLRAQNLDSLAGKVLRINTDGTAPNDNPFYNGNPNANRSKVYAYGFRNMFRFNFRPSNNSLYGGDVGWSTYEEINKIIPGGNYGWPCKEGAVITPGGLGCTAIGAIDPIYVYAHDTNGAGSVTAGSFPTGSAYPSSYANTYFFGDYAQNWIKTMTVNSSDVPQVISNFGVAADGTNGPVEFVTGPEGNIYFLSIYTGELKKITHTSGNRQPIVSISATPTSGLAPLSINFSSAGTNDPDGNPITYLWNFGDNSTSTSANPNKVYSINGSYTATLTVFDNQGGQTTKSIKITVGNQAPIAEIISPTNGSLYNVGQTLTLSGTGIDPETGSLPAGNLSWRVILHHNTHIHILETHTGNNVNITAPDHGDPDVYTEIELTVTDSAGLTNKKSIYIYLNNASTGNGNLVDNHSLETTDPQNPTAPANWAEDWWGVNSQIFSYPVAGYEGALLKGARVQITSYTSGDAKWAFTPVLAIPNTQYTFSDYYTSDVISTIVAEVTLTNGAKSYINLGTAPATTTFTKITRNFTTPANTRFLTVFHLLERVGTLTTDNYSLTIGSSDTIAPLVSITSPTASSTVSGIVNITASSTDNVAVAGVKFLVDGVLIGSEDTASPYTASWNTASSTNGIKTLRAVSRDLAGNVSTSSPISLTVNNNTGTTTGPNLINNGTFEAGTTLPTGWTKGGWGTNTRTLTYPVTGASSTKAVRVQISAHTSGDAKWVHTKIPVTPGKQYQYKDKYRSNIISDVIGEYTLSNGTFSYFGLQKEIQPNSNWTEISGTFNPPANATQVTFYHLISSVGWLEIDDVEVREIGSGNPGETVPPVVEFLTPTNNQTVSGIVNITASSSDNVGITYIFYAVDGNPITGQLTTAPYSFAWNTASTTNGPHLLKATTHDPSGNNSTSTITVIVNNATTTPDTIAPLVSITSPTASSTVSGIVNITASSTDNVAVAGVKFLVDGVLIGSEDTASPYTASWNTASSTNGSHTISAVSRDTSGNIATSTNVLVNVSNVVTPPPSETNLISNPSVETANGTKPLNWNNGKWGTNTTTFTYPTVGQEGAKGVGITTTSYTSGDAKWFFNDVTVVPGTTYTFSEYYKSNVVTNVTVRWTSSTGVVTYQSLGNPPASTNWTQRVNTVTVPAGVTKMTVFHLLNKVGTLEVDNVSLSIPGPSDTIAPLVSITSPTASSTVSGIVNITASSTDNVAVAGVKFLVDGVLIGSEDTASPYTASWNTASSTNGNHTISAVSRDTSGNIATSTNVLVNVSNVVADVTPPTISFILPAVDQSIIGEAHIELNASDNIGISDVSVFLDGILVKSFGTSTVYHEHLDTTLYTNGPHVFSAIARDSSNNTSTSTVNVTFANPVTDNTPAVTIITSPAAGSTLTGNATITVSAVDNVAVSKVHIFVDGINVSVDDTFPYEATIDTTVYVNGLHEISAYSEDTSNNIGNATPLNVNINNTPVIPPATNLILNPSLETVDTLDTSKPQNWFKGGWGTNNTVFTYPSAGNHLTKGAKIDITSYTDGDAKWFFTDVPVVAGETYTLRNEYKSNVPTVITARFGYPDNSIQYRDVANLASTTAWVTSENNILIPPGANKLTVFHIINSVGSLEVDNYYLSSQASSTNKFSQGMVSLTFDDGWISHYTEALPILNSSTLKAGFYIISQESIEAVPNNRVDNPNLESANPLSSTTPLKWSSESSGINDAVFTYPVTGQNGVGARTEITSYTSGEAKWVFENATAISNQEYKISFYHRNNVDAPIVGRFTLNDNSTFNLQIGVATTSAGWTKFEREFYMPINLKNFTMYTVLDKVGFVEIDTYDINRVPVFLSPSQIQEIKAQGHEIGSHTKTHPYLTTLNSIDLIDEVSGSKSDLTNIMGLSGINTFVYPYGDYDSTVRQAVVNAGYVGARTVDRGLNYKDTDKFSLKIQQVDRTTNMAQFQSWVDEARNNNAWLILMFHQVDNNPSATLGVTPSLFQEMVDALETQQVTVVTMEQGLGLMNP
jgi:glucose/arabinose dehydrogenase/peptidoglycan/xylan/chitin deacetylase (PgdA/CDA1 family)